MEKVDTEKSRKTVDMSTSFPSGKEASGTEQVDMVTPDWQY